MPQSLIYEGVIEFGGRRDHIFKSHFWQVKIRPGDDFQSLGIIELPHIKPFGKHGRVVRLKV